MGKMNLGNDEAAVELPPRHNAVMPIDCQGVMILYGA
jgi:hypothetical protein